MKVVVLGAAAGGGFPQWNVGSPSNRMAREGHPNAPPQTQSSVAVSAEGEQWFLLNASPDLRQQIQGTEVLHPRDTRHSPIAGVVLTNADVDHVAGLLTLREGHAFTLWASSKVLGTLEANPIFRVLSEQHVTRTPFELDRPISLGTGLTLTAFAVPGKVALYLEDPTQAQFGTEVEDTVGLEIRDTQSGRSFYYIPGCAAVNEDLRARLSGASLLFFDGTLYRDDEMIVRHEGQKTAQRMGHLSMSGDHGSIRGLLGLEIAKRYFIHINNTNPVLLLDSEERREVQDAGWGIAMDGMEFDV